MTFPAVDLGGATEELRELVDQASRSGEVVLTHGGEAVARIIPLARARGPRRPGSAQGLIHMADDFDDMPEELREYF